MIVLIVLDSVGVGALPDAEVFGDAGSHTLDHTVSHTGIALPHLATLGIGHIEGVTSVVTQDTLIGSYGRLQEVSPGKDTTTGHWEFMGLELEKAFQTFPPAHPSFPKAVMDAFDARTGLPHLGNYAASGTAIIEDLGPEHLRSGHPIVYTSADSVFQIAAHVDAVPLDTLYAWCEAAREILMGDYAVARVIARPFTGTPGHFERLGSARHDYSLSPDYNVLNALFDTGHEVIGVGKIGDIYDHCAFSREIKTSDNMDGVNKTLAVMQERPNGLIFTNLVEFDSKYGHRRNVAGYAQALTDFDARLPELLAACNSGDILMLVSDHGNDPTWHGTDHTREYGLFLCYGPDQPSRPLGTRESFADVGASIAAYLGVAWEGAGSSITW